MGPRFAADIDHLKPNSTPNIALGSSSGLEEVVLAGRLQHGANPVLRWMAGNVSVETDAVDNWKPSKKKSRERIDGIVALIMALDRASRQEESTSVYDQRGMYFVGIDDE